MRAKRSKKYRKLMHQYETAFGFREPYQVLADSHFLRNVHAFKMDILPALERTLQGKVKPFITKCTLAAVMAESPPPAPRSSYQPRPPQLPPPTVVPLRYCSHNENSTPIDEASCLLSLLSPNAEAKKNKEHYILATADPPAPAAPPTENSNYSFQKRRKPQPVTPSQPRYNLRRDVRMIPGVPIIYVKRSVMVLEPMSGPSEGVREGFEKGKLRSGFVQPANATGKRKREADGESAETTTKTKGSKKLKGANPLSMKKPKKRTEGTEGSSKRVDKSEKEKDADTDKPVDGEEPAVKTKRKRRHKKQQVDGEGASAGAGDGEGTPQVDTSIAVES